MPSDAVNLDGGLDGDDVRRPARQPAVGLAGKRSIGGAIGFAGGVTAG
jgi:hypothetical protein